MFTNVSTLGYPNVVLNFEPWLKKDVSTLKLSKGADNLYQRVSETGEF